MIEIKEVTKTFHRAKGLDHVSLSIEPGEMVALIGSSGSGKSTLLRHICGLTAADRSQNNSIAVNGHLIQKNGIISRNIRQLRSEIGVIFQQFNLVERMTAYGNACLGSLSRTSLWRSLTGCYTNEVSELAFASLLRVGIIDKAMERISNLSGGQQQRAAIARSLVQRAKVLLADEPIASLDPKSASNVMEILRDLNVNDGITVLVSLHQVDYALRFCKRTVALKKGKVVYDGPSENLTPQFLKRLYRGSDLILPDSHDLPQMVLTPDQEHCAA